MKLTVTLPWPDKVLSPNARKHWRATKEPKKQARADACWLTRMAMGALLGPTVTKVPHDGQTRIDVGTTAFPPDRRARDDRNLMGALKAAEDGISDALGIDDKFFRLGALEWGEVKRGGEIIITITLPEQEEF